jgi:hypothetical protein
MTWKIVALSKGPSVRHRLPFRVFVDVREPPEVIGIPLLGG